VGRLSRHAAARVAVAERRFVAHRFGFLLGSRFFPEVNPIAAGIAGAAGIAPSRYLLIAATSALTWAGAWTGAGYALGNVTLEIPKPFGVVTTFVLLAGVIAAVGFTLKHRRPVRSAAPWHPSILRQAATSPPRHGDPRRP